MNATMEAPAWETMEIKATVDLDRVPRCYHAAVIRGLLCCSEIRAAHYHMRADDSDEPCERIHFRSLARTERARAGAFRRRLESITPLALLTA